MIDQAGILMAQGLGIASERIQGIIPMEKKIYRLKDCYCILSRRRSCGHLYVMH